MTDLLTVAQYARLGVAGELVEGRLITSPAGLSPHNFACGNLIMQLAGQLPAHLEVVYGPDVDLELAPPDAPGFVRRPDVVVCHRGSQRLLRAAEVAIAVEVVSPDSRYTDRRAKRLDYAEAGIPFYWIVDLAPLSLTPLRLGQDRRYEDLTASTDVHESAEPFPVRIQLAQLID